MLVWLGGRGWGQAHRAESSRPSLPPHPTPAVSSWADSPGVALNPNSCLPVPAKLGSSEGAESPSLWAQLSPPRPKQAQLGDPVLPHPCATGATLVRGGTCRPSDQSVTGGFPLLADMGEVPLRLIPMTRGGSPLADLAKGGGSWPITRWLIVVADQCSHFWKWLWSLLGV